MNIIYGFLSTSLNSITTKLGSMVWQECSLSDVMKLLRLGHVTKITSTFINLITLQPNLTGWQTSMKWSYLAGDDDVITTGHMVNVCGIMSTSLNPIITKPGEM